MNIQPLWMLCLATRISILILAGYIANRENNYIINISTLILLTMGLGFIYKFLTGSNDEVQVAKVFWHETRIVHGLLYILAAYYLYKRESVLCMLVLGIDIIFSILYRIFTNQ